MGLNKTYTMKQSIQYGIVWLLGIALMSPLFGWSQGLVTGTVSDENGMPLPGATVVVEETNAGTTTDFDGNYQILASSGQTLAFGYVGYKWHEERVDEVAMINVQLQPANELEEIILTGQGSGIEKRKLSTTVDVLNSEEIDKFPATQIDQLLQSNTPSAQIRLSSGQPGTTAIIRTRGAISAATSSTPVVIVDGIRVDNLNSNSALAIDTGGANVSALADIPVESIERIEYIKGGAASTLYGADAANGVIQIITKKGKVGEDKVFIEAQIGSIQGTSDFLKYSRTAEAIFEPGLSNRYRFGFSGGDEKTTYNFSGSLYYDDSFNDLNEQTKRSFGFGLTRKISDRLSYQGSMSYVGFQSNLDYNANTSFSRFSAFEGGGRGDLDALDNEAWVAERDRARSIGENVDVNSTTNRFTTSNKLIYEVNDNIIINFTTGVDYRTTVQQENLTNNLQIVLDSEPPGTTDKALLNRSLRNHFTLTSDLNLTHRGTFNNISFVTIGGFQFFRTTDRQNLFEGSGGVDGSTSINTFPTISGSDFTLENANYGLYILENLGIDDLLFFEFGGRLDYNTASGENTSAIFLPKFGLSYNVSDYDFYQSSSIRTYINSIKLRANYGEATNFARPFSQDRTFALESFLGKPAFRFDNPGNQDLRSETVKTTEFGIDLSFFNNRIGLSGTVYESITEDALFTPTQPPSSGLLNQIQNIGEVKNSGIELALKASIIQNDNHNLDFSISYNTNNNIVTSTGGAAPFVVGGFTVIGSWVEEGQPLGYLRGTAATANGDGTYTFTPNSTLGNTFADEFGSISLNYS